MRPGRRRGSSSTRRSARSDGSCCTGPDLELRRLTLANKDELLFDDVLWVRQAHEEHDAFADTLAEAGVEVLYLQALLAEVLADAGVRADLIARSFEAGMAVQGCAGRPRSGSTASRPGRLPPGSSAASPGRTCPSSSRGLPGRWRCPGEFALDPLPNHILTGDTSSWICNGVSINAMAAPARAVSRCTWRPSTVTPRCSRRSSMRDLERWSATVRGVGRRRRPGDRQRRRPDRDGPAYPARCRGGARRAVVGRRRGAAGDRRATPVPAVDDAPGQRAHDGRSRRVHRLSGAEEASTGYLLEPGPTGVTVQHEDELFATIARVLDLPKVQLFETGGDRYEAEREQWEDGNNVLALAPGVVVAYERKVETNTRLRHDRIQVITIEGSELGRSRAGPRRMSCPIERTEVCAATAALVSSP